MAKDRKKDAKKDAKKVKGASATRHTSAGGEHHAARAHGQASRIDTSLPATREALLSLHAEARRRRNAAALGSAEFRSAVDEIERIEIRVASIERAQDPPLV